MCACVHNVGKNASAPLYKSRPVRRFTRSLKTHDMPSFETCVLSAPTGRPLPSVHCRCDHSLIGFFDFCCQTNKLSQEKFVELGRPVFAAVLAGIPTPTGNSNNEQQIINGLAFLARSCHSATPIPEDKEIAVTLLNNTLLSKPSIELFIGLWKAVKGEKDSHPAGNPKVGELESLSWKVGVSLQSSACVELLQPYVSLTMGIKDSEGHVSHNPCDLSYTEFQVMLYVLRVLFVSVLGV